MGKRNRKRAKRQREREQRMVTDNGTPGRVVCVDRSDWRSLYRYESYPAWRTGGCGTVPQEASPPTPHRVYKCKPYTPPTAFGIEGKLHSWGLPESCAEAAPLSDVDPAARKSDDGDVPDELWNMGM